MPKPKSTKKVKTPQAVGNDGQFLLKLALYIILGTLWIKVGRYDHDLIPIPVGLIVGFIFASHEHFQIDRKIEYAVLLVAALFGFIAPFGLYLTF